MILLALIILALMYFAFGFLASHHTGFSKEELDWNDDGTVDVGEYWRASDIGKRLVYVSGEPCDEYFNYKDGLEFKIVCSGRTMDLFEALKTRMPAPVKAPES